MKKDAGAKNRQWDVWDECLVFYLVDHLVSTEMELICYTKSSSCIRTGYKFSNQCGKLQCTQLSVGRAAELPGLLQRGSHGNYGAETALCKHSSLCSTVPTQTSCWLVSSGTQSDSQTPGNVLTAFWGEIMASSTYQDRKAAKKETQVYMGDTLQSNAIASLGWKKP